jgi:hypothetical protein
MNTTHKLVGAFAAVIAVLALGTTLQAAVTDATRANPAVTARALAHEAASTAMVQRNAGGERTGNTAVSG